MSDLQELLDERALREGLAGFARVIDARDWSALSDVFADDVVFDYGSGSEESGLAALELQMRRFLDACGPTQHLIGSILIDLRGDEALSRSYVQARHQRKHDVSGDVFDSCGEYIDRWKRQSEGWRIVKRHAVWLLHTGNPAILSSELKDLG